jgi:hypothetical protein
MGLMDAFKHPQKLVVSTAQVCRCCQQFEILNFQESGLISLRERLVGSGPCLPSVGLAALYEFVE